VTKPMDPDRWQQITEIFHGALAREPSSREPFVAAACRQDASLRAEVDRLLVAHEAAGEFGERLAASVTPEQWREIEERYRPDRLVSGADGVERSSPADRAHAFGPGSLLGPYRIDALLGSGGMGVVYRARDTRLDRFVAVKVLPPERVADPDRERRFVQEAKAASALNHPNIVSIYDIHSDGNVLLIAMEHVEGKTLGEAIGGRGLSLRQLLAVGAQIAGALAAAHARGIVHRDLKPGNVMVTPDGLVKVLDFGLAKLIEPVTEDERTMTEGVGPQTMEGRIVGTPSYMSPEQAQGRPVDARTDVFSFGSVLYEMATGQRAFAGESTVSILSKVVDSDPPPARAVRRELPRELERIIELCLKKDHTRRFQSMADVKLQLETLGQELDSGILRAAESNTTSVRRPWMWTAAAILALAAIPAAVWQWRVPHSIGEATLTQLTYDQGLATDPAFSPDGKLLVYAADRAGTGLFDIWVQQVGGGEAVRLTRDHGQNLQPSFSPDGTRIVFRSTHENGGIFVTSTFPGKARKIASLTGRNNGNPVFSPDGNSIAYWTGTHAGLALTGGAKVWVVNASAGAPREVSAGFSGMCCPIWTPDGKHLLVLANHDTVLPVEERLDWWVIPVDGDRPIRTGALAITRFRNLTGSMREAPYALSPGPWNAAGDAIVFSARSGDSTNLWQLALSPRSFKATGTPQKLTSGTAIESQPAAAAVGSGVHRIVYSSHNRNTDIWTVPVAANEAKPIGEARRLTESAASDAAPHLSLDGRKLSFISTRTGLEQIWVRDLDTGAENPVTSSRRSKYGPATLSPDGWHVAYSEKGTWAMYLLRVADGGEELIEGATGLATAWTADGRALLYHHDHPNGISLLDLATRRSILLLRNPGERLYHAQVSPDGNWLSFSGTGRILVAPFRGATEVDRADWIQVTGDAGGWSYWSPDSSIVYSISQRDGYPCLWATRLDRVTKRPMGPPVAVHHEHGPSFRMGGDLALVGDRIVFTGIQTTGNIWMAEWKQ
jgi:eukaryotic-like serine/threonine-protein kinase